MHTNEAPDPRVVGGTYRCFYWRDTYEVLAIDDGEFTVRWSDGHVTRHFTAWDRRDTVISTPDSRP